MSIAARILSIATAIAVFFTGLIFTGQLAGRAVPAPETGPLGRYANPFVGTGGIPWSGGMTNPGATAPFGAVQLCPDTCWAFGFNVADFGKGGYWYGKTRTYGFSHTRFSGAGITEGGLFRVTPGLGDADPLKRLERPLLFSHGGEAAAPGYYAAWLPGAACLAELTATAHTGVHRYTFQSDKDALLFLDATSNLKNDEKSGQIEVIDEHTIEGRMDGKAWFRAEFDTPFTAEAWLGNELLPNETRAEGTDVGLALRFGSMKDKSITLRLGISYVSREGARANLLAESAGKSFGEVYASTRDAWEERLSSIEIQSSDEEIKRAFYTAMYQSMIHPTNMTDATGEYLGFGGEIGSAKDFTYRSDLSLWDSFRTTHPLYILIAPDIQHDSARSLLLQAAQHGGFPRWPRLGGEGGSMFGNPAHIVMAETYMKGQLRREDAITSLQFMKDTVFLTVPEGKPSRGRDFGSEYNNLGYVPVEIDAGRAVSRTLEYAWADHAAWRLADALGDREAAEAFRKLSLNYRNLFNPETKYFQARNSAGEWQRFSPYVNTYYDFLTFGLAEGFNEGSARQYRWHAPQDPQWLIESMGGAQAFVKELDRFMRDASSRRAALFAGSGWWVGNEHNLHAPYLFAEAGRPDLTQKWVRWTLRERFADRPDGLDGNEDLGALSAWYIFGALGFYPIAGTDQYWLGSPNVEQAVLRLGDGKTLTVKAVNQGAKNVYVKSVKINGVLLDGWTFTHDLIANGGLMEFEMAAKA